MILLKLDEDKVISFALVPYLPSDDVIAMAADQPQGDYDKVKLLPQLQILRRSDLTVINSATLTPHELKCLLYLGRAIGKSLESMTEIVDSNFEEYRVMVKRQQP